MKCIKSPYFRAFMHFLFSHIGLCILVSSYCVLGALMFIYFESDLEKQAVNESRIARCEAEMERQDLIDRIYGAYNSGDLHVATMKKWLDEFHFDVLTKEHVRLAYRQSTDTCDDKMKYKWTMASAVLFTVTTVGCIGYGNLVPTTDLSQFALICYSLIGIPLTLMFLANVGRLFANTVRVMFSHGVCYFCWKRRNRNRAHFTRVHLTSGHSVATTSTHIDEGEMNRKKRLQRQATVKGEIADLFLRPETEQEEKERERLQMVVPKSFIFSVLALWGFLGTLLFAWAEEWTYIQSAYFNVVTLMTIGLGDLVPGWTKHETVIGKVKMGLSAVYIMLGLGVLFMGLNIIVDELMTASEKAGKKMGLVKEEQKKKAKGNLERAVRRQVY